MKFYSSMTEATTEEKIRETINLLILIQNAFTRKNLYESFHYFEQLSDFWHTLPKMDYETAQELFSEISSGYIPDWSLNQFVLDW